MITNMVAAGVVPGFLTNADSLDAAESDITEMLEDLINQVDSDGETTNPTTKKFNSDFFGNILKMITDSIAD